MDNSTPPQNCAIRALRGQYPVRRCSLCSAHCCGHTLLPPCPLTVSVIMSNVDGLSGLNCVPPKRHAQDLTSGTCERDLIWRAGLCRCNRVKMRSKRVDPKSAHQKEKKTTFFSFCVSMRWMSVKLPVVIISQYMLSTHLAYFKLIQRCISIPFQYIGKRTLRAPLN